MELESSEPISELREPTYERSSGIDFLASISLTEQHEEILLMLDYYGVQGTKYLEKPQIDAYVTKRKIERNKSNENKRRNKAAS